MAIFRNIQMTFWTDPKVTDDFTPEDKFMYLYLMTNPHTNLSGCYEISETQMSNETGYSKQIVKKILDRLIKVHKVVLYSNDTKEMLILNWSKYNWTSSEKFRKPLLKEIQIVKNSNFKSYLEDLFNGIDTVSIPYTYPIDTNCIDTTVTDTDTITDSITDSITNKNTTKHIYGEYKHILLTDNELNNLFNDYGESETLKAIKYLDEYIQMNGKKYKDHNLVLRKWVFDAVKRDNEKQNKPQAESFFEAMARA